MAYVDDKIVGYLAGGFMDNSKTYRVLSNPAELENIFVLPKYRDMDIGSQLLETFKNRCK